MKKSKLLFMAGLIAYGFFFTPQVNAASEIEVNDKISFQNCIKTDGNICKLTADIDVLERTEISNKNITINLNGYNLNLGDKFIIQAGTEAGSVTVEGKGEVISSGTTVFALTGYDATKKQTLTLGKNVKVVATNSTYGYGVLINPNNKGTPSKVHSYGVVVNSDASFDVNAAAVYVNGQVKDTKNYPIINFGKNTNIKAKQTGIYAAGYAQWNFDGGLINAGGAGLAIKSGKVTVNNTTINVTGQYNNGKPQGDGVDPTGSVFQIESNKGYAGEVELIVNDGKYTSLNGPVFHEYSTDNDTNVNSLSIDGGVYKAADGIDAIVAGTGFKTTHTNFVKSGNFSAALPEEYLAECLVQDESSNVVLPVETVKPNEPAKEEVVANPETSDGIILYIAIATVAAAGVAGTLYRLKKRS